MFRSLAALSVWGPGKWAAFACALLVPGSFLVLLVLWLVAELKGGDPSERYLAEATSLAELERRMRVLERGRGEPAFVTFNH
jgi:hypothetical protein